MNIIQWVVELVEGKDRSQELGNCKFDDCGGKKYWLLLQMLIIVLQQENMLSMIQDFVSERNCWVENKGILEHWLRSRNIGQQWSLEFDKNFKSKEVGDIDDVSGKLNGTDYFIWVMKEPNYVVKIMGSGGSLNLEGYKEVQCRWKNGDELYTKKFAYTTPLKWHFSYCHIFGNYNNLWCEIASIKDTWRTVCWLARVFLFLSALTKVNIYLAITAKKRSLYIYRFAI